VSKSKRFYSVQFRVKDLPTGPKQPHSTVLPAEEEAMVAALHPGAAMGDKKVIVAIAFAAGLCFSVRILEGTRCVHTHYPSNIALFFAVYGRLGYTAVFFVLQSPMVLVTFFLCPLHFFFGAIQFLQLLRTRCLVLLVAFLFPCTIGIHSVFAQTHGAAAAGQQTQQTESCWHV
jgi:hypothetical protein